MLAEGVWAEVKVGGEHLRLFSEHNALGVQASVYNVSPKNWIAPSESVDDIEQGKERAEAYAKAYLKKVNLELPPIRVEEVPICVIAETAVSRLIRYNFGTTEKWEIAGFFVCKRHQRSHLVAESALLAKQVLSRLQRPN